MLNPTDQAIRALPLTSHKPVFMVGNEVCEKFPFASTSRKRGIVIKGYEFEREYRYIVRFENGREEVFFERELIAHPGKPD